MTTVVDLLRTADDDGRPAYERYADAIAAAITSGRLAPGAKLPTVRKLASELGVSATTVMSMYARLSEHGHTSGEPGRGTFVTTAPAASGPGAGASRRDSSPRPTEPWRRRALAESEARLRERFPAAVDLMRGSPAVRLLPLDLVQAAWTRAGREYRQTDLEYPHSLAIDPALGDVMVERLGRDGVEATPETLVAMNSAQQTIALVSQLLVRNSDSRPLVAVEQPGYQTAMDTLERAGCRLIGLEIDEEGVRPESLRATVDAGAKLVVFTPRALSPSGATWTAERRTELAAILAGAKDVWILEDDYFAELSAAHPGSLSSTPQLRDRVIHVRSFSKSIAPDLRTAVASVGAAVRGSLMEERSYADGWTSVFAQRTLAGILTDPALEDRLRVSGDIYRANRAAAVSELSAALGPEGLAADSAEGLHVWVPMPSGVRSDGVVEAAARSGYLLADGEPFFLDPGVRSFIRVNVGAADPDRIPEIAQAIITAVDESVGRGRVLLSP